MHSERKNRIDDPLNLFVSHIYSSTFPTCVFLSPTSHLWSEHRFFLNYFLNTMREKHKWLWYHILGNVQFPGPTQIYIAIPCFQDYQTIINFQTNLYCYFYFRLVRKIVLLNMWQLCRHYESYKKFQIPNSQASYAPWQL